MAAGSDREVGLISRLQFVFDAHSVDDEYLADRFDLERYVPDQCRMLYPDPNLFLEDEYGG